MARAEIRPPKAVGKPGGGQYVNQSGKGVELGLPGERKI
jgi:hypothetical protein